MTMMLIRVWMEDKQSGAESPGIINGITAAHIDHIDHHHRFYDNHHNCKM